jgi:hypothetical protein
MNMRVVVNIRNKKLYGILFMLAGTGVGALAQYVLLLSTQNALAYWDWNGWWEKSLHNTFPLPGVLLYVLAGVLLILGLHSIGDRLPAFKINLDPIPFRIPRPGLWLIALGVAVAIAFHSAYTLPHDPYGYFVLAAWVFAIIMPVYSSFLAEDRRHFTIGAIRDWLRAHRAELIVLATILVAAFLIFTPTLSSTMKGTWAAAANVFLAGSAATSSS